MPLQEIPHITCEHLRKLRADEGEHVVVDLRDPLEFEAGHIQGSVNVPQRELTTNIDAFVPKKEHKVIVVIGPTQHTDIEKIHEELDGLGYKKVEFLAGGFDRWCEIAPLEVEPDLTDLTPEEEGFVGDELGDIDPEKNDNEPPM
ncbi:MAG: rhodanese-like domain-containing protein [Patescibacteria group bacterium]|nr:rhodanese-like domain-containing protein [Patescibacteria group bacterium]